jgi:hypothetical protein
VSNIARYTHREAADMTGPFIRAEHFDSLSAQLDSRIEEVVRLEAQLAGAVSALREIARGTRVTVNGYEYHVGAGVAAYAQESIDRLGGQ